MEITYIGHSCFKIKNKDLTLVIDPYHDNIGYKMPKIDADVVLCTHQHEDHNNISAIKDPSLVITSAGEYEKSDVFIQGVQVAHDKNNGADRGMNVIYEIFMDGITVLHVGDLGHDLSQETLKKISDVDVLMVPVGGAYTLDAKGASDVISSVEPGIVIPMHYATKDLTGIKDLDPLEKFLDEMGVGENLKHKDFLVLNSKASSSEDTEIVVLKPNH
jgi:L-ascorbate metabolism protein UlaG (beta-lactamase superfamily)